MDEPRKTVRLGMLRGGVWIVSAGVAPLIVSGCGGTAPAGSIATQQVTPNDFQAAGEADAVPVEPEQTRAEDAARPRVISAQEARGGERDVMMLVGRPAEIRGPVPSGGERVQPGGAPSQPVVDDAGDERPVFVARGENEIVIDEMVGQINGRPVYAAAFLSSLDDILRAEAIEKGREEWIRTASQLIQNQLLERIRDELLIAEFNADLTFDERVGLFSFIEQIQQGIIDRDLGSAARADERLRDQENVSLRGKAQEQFNREIVFEQLRREVTRKVQVSWRDIRRYYEQNLEIFQPPSTAKLRVLRVDPADREAVGRALEGVRGSDRASLIAERTTFRSAEGGLIEMELGPDGLAAAEFFGPAELNDPATGLSVGQISEPIEFSGAVWWLWLEDIETPEAVSLYDAQNRIEQAIRSEREQQERARYFQRLFGTSAMTEQQLGEMRDRLIQFAIDRYLGPEGSSDW